MRRLTPSFRTAFSEMIKVELKIRETKISELEEMIESLEQKMNEQDRTLSSIEGP